MALGGGTWTVENKVLPGTYENFVSLANASATLSDRGVVTMPISLGWGASGEIIELEAEDFQKNSLSILGYAYNDDAMKPLRELFLNAKKAYLYRLNGSGVKATNKWATAKCAGTRGNDIKIGITANVDDTTKFDVTTYIGTSAIDTQTVATSADLVENYFVSFKDEELAVQAPLALSGGTDSSVTGADHQAYLDLIESYSYNTMGVETTDATTKRLYTSFVKRLRDDVGKKFQLVLYNYNTADYIGVISVDNKVTDGAVTASGATTYPNEAKLVYWVTGLQAGCAVNASCQHRRYDGEYTVDTAYTQTQLTKAINEGKFVLHQVNDDVRVLMDVNTFQSVTDEMGDDFKDNQVIRVIDQLANDDAVIFSNRYLGVVPNDDAGRAALWNDLVKLRKDLLQIRAIENFSDDDLTVAQGNSKKSVVVTETISVVSAMSQLYVSTTVA